MQGHQGHATNYAQATNFDEIPSGPVSHNTSSYYMGDPMITETPMTAYQHPAERHPLWHTFPQEQGGPNIMAFTKAMKDDATAQEHIVELLGTLLDKTVQRNDSLGRKSELEGFEVGKPCPLTASAYLKRIMKYGGCSPCCVVVGLMYLQRLKQQMPSVCLTSGNMQRLLLTSVMVAAKYLDDLYYSNKHWARIGGLELVEVNLLELKLLFHLNFSLKLKREEYQEYLQGLVGASNIAPPTAVAMEEDPVPPPVQRRQDHIANISSWQHEASGSMQI